MQTVDKGPSSGPVSIKHFKSGQGVYPALIHSCQLCLEPHFYLAPCGSRESQTRLIVNPKLQIKKPTVNPRYL